MPLPLHIFIHFVLAVLVGGFVGRYFKNIRIGLAAGIMGGFLIDLDHILEYFLIFGPHFNPAAFFAGREFLVSDKIYLWGHAWEWLPLLLLIAWLLRKRTALKIFFITLALAAGVHLLTDTLINRYPLKFYSLVYRQSVGFSAPKLLSPEQYQKDLELKGKLGI